MSTRPSGPRNRPRHPEPVIERMRAERLDPQPGQWDYLHLLVLRDGLVGALARLPRPVGPVLDLFCGTQPYRELIPSARIYGLDLDLHFGRADVLGTLPLPFRDGAFAVVVCTQTLYLLDDPPAAVAEMARVLAPGGRAVVTVPRRIFRPLPIERRWDATDLEALFAGWGDVRVDGSGSVGATGAYVVGRLAEAAARRVPGAAALLRPFMWVVNAAAAAVEVLARPLARRRAHILVLTATVPQR
jgi:SAM-dependent methyltransferase